MIQNSSNYVLFTSKLKRLYISNFVNDKNVFVTSLFEMIFKFMGKFRLVHTWSRVWCATPYSYLFGLRAKETEINYSIVSSRISSNMFEQ